MQMFCHNFENCNESDSTDDSHVKKKYLNSNKRKNSKHYGQLHYVIPKSST